MSLKDMSLCSRSVDFSEGGETEEVLKQTIVSGQNEHQTFVLLINTNTILLKRRKQTCLANARRHIKYSSAGGKLHKYWVCPGFMPAGKYCPLFNYEKLQKAARLAVPPC